MALSISGLASGFDWKSVVDQLTEVERAPQSRLRLEQSTLQQRNNAFSSIKTQLGVLQNRLKLLKDPALFDSRGVSVSNAALATATTSAGTPLGSHAFNVTQLATAAALQGTADIGNKLSATDDVSGLNLSEAAFRSPITAGQFTVNGKAITLEATDTLQGVFDKISTATGGNVTATYDSASDRIRFSGTGAIVLGSATDTSNFLQAARLSNNGTGTVESSASLGAIRRSQPLASGNFTTPISGTGEFKVNGVSISYDASTDSLSSLLQRINSSTAGVNAGYDSVNDRLVLTNRTTGDMGVAVEDVTGNFAAASGLASGTLQRGKDLIYTVNGSGPLKAASNTITEETSGIAGLSVTALAEGSFTVGVSVDTQKIKTTVNEFVTEYNKTQSLINTNTASTTDAKGKVTAGLLASDSEAALLNSDLRKLANRTIDGMTGAIKRLESLGITSNGNDDALALSEATRLDDAINSNGNSLKDFFTNTTNGFATLFHALVEKNIGENGTLITRQSTLATQAKNIDGQLSAMERMVLANKERLTTSFIAMETAQARINQQMQYLQRTFPG